MWFASAPYWLSDDFLAITYAHDARHAWADFAGPQYASPGMVRLYRPLITSSFALDAWLGGGAPLVSFASNLLAHATSTMLLALLGARVLGAAGGLFLALLWAMWPTHAGSILWAVGRVDSHTTVWILLALWATQRWLDTGSRGARAVSLLAFVAALLSKELALATPGLVALLGAQRGPRRVRAACAAMLPFAILLLPYFGLRWLALGRLLGGYDDAPFALGPALAGLLTWTARLANPWWDEAGSALAPGVQALGFAPFALGLACALHAGRARTVAWLACAYVCAAVPTLPFWAETGEVKNLRYLYLPAACLLGIVAAGGRWPTVVALLAAALPFSRIKAAYAESHGRARVVHAALRAEDAALPPGPLFVAGLPRENEARSTLLFHLWVDRLLAPPFGTARRLFALRPLVPRAGVLPSPFGADVGFDDGFTLVLGDDGRVARRLAPSGLPRFEVDLEGSSRIDVGALWDMYRDRTDPAIMARGVRTPWLRLTLCTAGGWIVSVLPNETPASGDARVGIESWLRARYATEGDDAHVLFALPAAATFDLQPTFPLLVEAGDVVDGDAHRFVAQAQAARVLWLGFARDIVEFVRGRAADPRR